MREATVFICDVCGDTDEDRQKMVKHEEFCLLKKERAEKELAERKATGQLTIGQIISKCENLPNLPVMIVSEASAKYNGKYPEGTNSYRGYYDELAIDTGNKAMSLSSFLDEMRKSLRRTYGGWKGGDYNMHKDTFVWLSEPGEASQVIVTDVRLSASGESIYLCVKQLED
jgi:hypothetical protein